MNSIYEENVAKGRDRVDQQVHEDNIETRRKKANYGMKSGPECHLYGYHQSLVFKGPDSNFKTTNY
jgi:hypothetical protein